MVFLIADCQKLGKIILVKADSNEQVLERLKLKETQDVIGRLTDADLAVLNSAGFAVIET